MNAIPVDYLLRLSISWGVLLSYYHLFFAKNHNWQLRRVFLLSTYLLGIVIPLLPALEITQMPAALPDLSVIPNFTFEARSTPLAVVENSSYSWWFALPLLYGLGVVFQLGLFLRNTWQIWHWKQIGEQRNFGRYAIVEHHSIPSPFAGWRTIFLPLKLEAELESVACLHEAAHLRSHHNLERLPIVLGQILFWFHPLQWYYNHALATVQEYQADEAVLQHIPTKTYGHILIQQSMRPMHQWQAGLFASPLKQRINMMVSQKNKQPWRLPQLGLFLGLLGLLVFSCSDFITSNQPDFREAMSYTEADQVPVLITTDDPTTAKSPFNRDLLEKIYSQIKYPAEARSNGLEGTVIAKFIITEEGKIDHLSYLTRDGQCTIDEKGKLKLSNLKKQASNILIDQDEIVVVGYANTKPQESSPSINMGTLALAVDAVMTKLPDWHPAVKDGKTVPVAMHIPVKFKLEN